jgi:glucosamine--fructose-6-phosphate aminotransferase (isomerizing)
MRTCLEAEIREQPEVLSGLLSSLKAPVRMVSRHLAARPAAYVVIAGRGSSDNVARYAQYLFGARLGLPVALASPSLQTLYGVPSVPVGAPALVVGISQSGRSPDVVEVVASAARSGAPTLAITNDPGSPLAQVAEYVIALESGQERSVAATKTYTASLLAVAVLVAELGKVADDRVHLAAVPRFVEHALVAAYEHVERLDTSLGSEHVVALGRGFNYSTALEIALKLRELTGAVAEGYSPADLMHGPIVSITARTTALVIAPPGPTLASMEGALSALRDRHARSLVIGEQTDAALPLPLGVPEWLSPIVAVVPGQVLAERHTLLRGLDPDRPQGISKVTETL